MTNLMVPSFFNLDQFGTNEIKKTLYLVKYQSEIKNNRNILPRYIKIDPKNYSNMSKKLKKNFEFFSKKKY